MPRIDLYANMELVVKLKLGSGSILIGRSGDCDVQLPNDRVSRQHARIDHTGDSYEIADLSANGTRLNARMLTGTDRLAPGDRIYIEDYVLIYQPDDAPAEKLEEDSTILR